MAAPLVAGSAAVLIAGATAPDPQGYAGLRRWSPGDAAKRLSDRSVALCGGTSLRQLDTLAALTDSSGPDPQC